MIFLPRGRRVILCPLLHDRCILGVMKMDDLYHALRLIRSLRYGDLLTAAVGILAFLLFIGRRGRK